MGKRILLFCCIVALLNCFIAKAWSAENNKVGIHILETSEVEKAAKLVNSSGGDWGYVTIVLRDDDLNQLKWQKFMDDCRKLHLIPIVRIATHSEAGVWVKPKMEELDKWVQFLHALNWPVREQLVVLFNEPNHAVEWGGQINPQEYATVVDSLIQKFNDCNSDFVAMMAGLDQAADGLNGTMREEEFLVGMARAVPDIFEKVEGWASHSYPRSFVGRPEEAGRGSIKGYEWELDQIKEQRAKSKDNKEIDVYITETGWPASSSLGKSAGIGYYNDETAAEFMQQALAIWEKDEQVKAVTPFVLNYQEAPFEKFSWVTNEGAETERFKKVLGVSKVSGEPEQVEKYEILKWDLPEILPTNFEYKGKVKIKNTGQWIMGEEDNIKNKILNIKNESEEFGDSNRGCQIIQPRRLDSLATSVQPGEEAELEFRIKTGTQSAECKLRIGDREKTIYVFKPWDLKNTHVSLWRQIWTRIRLWLSNDE